MPTVQEDASNWSVGWICLHTGWSEDECNDRIRIVLDYSKTIWRDNQEWKQEKSTRIRDIETILKGLDEENKDGRTWQSGRWWDKFKAAKVTTANTPPEFFALFLGRKYCSRQSLARPRPQLHYTQQRNVILPSTDMSTEPLSISSAVPPATNQVTHYDHRTSQWMMVTVIINTRLVEERLAQADDARIPMSRIMKNCLGGWDSRRVDFERMWWKISEQTGVDQKLLMSQYALRMDTEDNATNSAEHLDRWESFSNEEEPRTMQTRIFRMKLSRPAVFLSKRKRNPAPEPNRRSKRHR